MMSCGVDLKNTWTLFHFDTIFVPPDQWRRNPKGKTRQDQRAAAVNVLIGQILAEPWPSSL